MKIKEIFKHTFIYGLSNSIERSAGLILIPIYTRYLLPEEYGVLAICQLVIEIMAIFYELGMRGALFRFYFDYETKEEKKSLIGTTVIFLLFSNLVLTSIVWFFSNRLSFIIFEKQEFEFFITIIASLVFIENLLKIPFIIFRANNLSKSYFMLNMAKFFLNIGLNIFFVIYLRKNILGILESKLITVFVLLTILSPFILKNVKWTLSISKLKKLFHFGLPLIPTNLIGVLLSLSDRYILRFFVGYEDIGIYSLGYKFGSIINMVAVNAIVLSLPSVIIDITKEKDGNKKIARISTYYFIMVAFIVAFISIFANEIIKITSTEKYYNAVVVIPFVCFAFLFHALYRLFEIGIFIKKKSNLYPIITGTATVLNIALNFWLIPKIGYIAAAINTLIAYFFMAALSLYFSNKVYPIPYEYKRITGIFACCTVLALLGYFIRIDDIILSALIKAVIFCLFPIIIYYSGLLTKHELSKLNGMFKKIHI